MKLLSPTKLPLKSNKPIESLAIAIDGSDVVVGQGHGLNSRSKVFQPALSRWSLPLLSELAAPSPCPFTPDGERFVSDHCSTMARSEHWLAAAGARRRLMVQHATNPGEWTEPVDSEVSWARLAGPMLAVGGERTRIHNLESGMLAWCLGRALPGTGTRNTPVCPKIAFRPDRKAFAVGGVDESNLFLYSMNLQTSSCGTIPLRIFSGAPDRLDWLGFSPDGKHLAAKNANLDYDHLLIWREGQTDPHLRKVQSASTLAFHPDAEHFVTALASELRIHRLSDGEQIGSRKFGRDTRQIKLEFTPDGSMLITGDRSGRLLAWPVA
ncbi:WD40 repeat domain-containing protein [Pseudomonas sp. CGJS7]|uniref:WD40 repeat domain-containing protein n=1 Tax=Pseudomonas sp. CGJS7 TaxID=3109348 RepID=UPI003009578A